MQVHEARAQSAKESQRNRSRISAPHDYSPIRQKQIEDSLRKVIETER